MWRHVMLCRVKRPSNPIRTVEEAFWTLWRHHYDVTVSRDIIGDVTNRLPMATFLQAPNRKESAICNSFRDIWPEIVWLRDVIADVMTPGSTLHVDTADDYVKRLSKKKHFDVVTSRLWRHGVTWRHRWRHHSTALGHFPIGSNRKVRVVNNTFWKYWQYQYQYLSQKVFPIPIAIPHEKSIANSNTNTFWPILFTARCTSA